MISLAFNRGSMLHEARLRKLEVVVLGVFESQSESPHSSGTVLLSWSPESPLRAQIFEERKKVAAFVDREQAHTVNQPELHLATTIRGFLHRISSQIKSNTLGVNLWVLLHITAVNTSSLAVQNSSIGDLVTDSLTH